MGTTLLGDNYYQSGTELWINGPIDQRFCSRTIYEDPKCSSSLGPAYTIVDHLTYFDTNLGTVAGQPAVFTYLPIVFNPLTALPPLPTKLQNLFSGLAGGGIGTISPLLG